MRFWLVLFGCWASQVVACDLPPDWQGSADYQAVEWRVVYDGDTLQLSDGRRVRLIGIDTPELAREDKPEQPLAAAAKAALEGALADTRQIVIRMGKDDRDRYGRLLAHAFSRQGSNLTVQLLEQGLGYQVVIPPNVWAADCYARAEGRARKARLGVWQHPYFAPRAADESARLLGGHGIYRGRIEKVSQVRDGLWVDLVGDISVRFHLKHAEHLRGADLDQLLLLATRRGTTPQPWHLEARGWLVDRREWGAKMQQQIAAGKRKRWQLDVRHRLQWQLLPAPAEQ